MYQHLLSFMLQLTRLCVWLVLLMVVFVPLERIFSRRSQKVLRQSLWTDVTYYFLGGILPKLLLIVPMTIVAAIVHRLVPLGFYDAVAAMPLWLRMPAALVVGETGAYWGHRWSHESSFLWRFHAIHHSAEDIDWLVSSRAHPVDHFFTRLCMLTPMYVLGLAQPMGNRVDLVSMIVTVIGTYWGFFIHANINWRFGWLEWLLATPAFHHWHHTNDGPAVINKNYAPMLPWVDWVFGTLHLPKDQWPEKYGTDTQVSSHLAGQLLNPLMEAAWTPVTNPSAPSTQPATCPPDQTYPGLQAALPHRIQPSPLSPG